jgi:hypothetical protein
MHLLQALAQQLSGASVHMIAIEMYIMEPVDVCGHPEPSDPLQ